MCEFLVVTIRVSISYFVYILLFLLLDYVCWRTFQFISLFLYFVVVVVVVVIVFVATCISCSKHYS